MQKISQWARRDNTNDKPGYAVPRSRTPVDLYLDGNEGAQPPVGFLEFLSQIPPDVLRRYPDSSALETNLASRLGVNSSRVVVTAGADDAIERVCRYALSPGGRIVLPVPTFEMLERYADGSGAHVDRIEWPDAAYPTGDVVAAVRAGTAVIAVVSPNNPTGGVASVEDLRRISKAAPDALILVDAAYGEFADEDLTTAALALPNTIVLKTFSKAYGLAGIRIGYAVGPAGIVESLRALAPPYPVSGLSLEIASRRLEESNDVPVFVERIREERRLLVDLLRGLGQRPQPSQGNFVMCRVRDAEWIRDALAGMGIAVRIFPDKKDLTGAVRITCPGERATYGRLENALRTVLSPQAVLFDMDGVLADTRLSYDAAVINTAASFGVQVTREQITDLRVAGDANNDWVLTHTLLERSGVGVALSAVTEKFEMEYQGTPDAPGLCRFEQPLVTGETLERINRRVPLGIVTGRPRRDAERFLCDHGLARYFATVVCMEDAAIKPDPAPVRLAMQQLSAGRAWMVGDTPDDARAARRAGALPIGVTGCGMDETQILAGAARLVGGAGEILDWLEVVS
jgi:histidinol-phosphate aminotransferase